MTFDLSMQILIYVKKANCRKIDVFDHRVTPVLSGGCPILRVAVMGRRKTMAGGIKTR